MTPIPFEYKKTKYHYVVYGILVLIIAYSSLIELSNTLEKIETKDEYNKWFKLVAEIEVEKPDGTIIKQCKDNDIILNNYAHMLAELFDMNNVHVNNANTTTGSTVDWKDTGSVLNIDDSESYILVGNGTTTPSIYDYNMDNLIDSTQVSTHAYSTSGNEFNLTITATWNPLASYSIREMGLTIEAQPNNEDVLICRDVITSVPVENGDVVTLKYVWLFNEGV